MDLLLGAYFVAVAIKVVAVTAGVVLVIALVRQWHAARVDRRDHDTSFTGLDVAVIVSTIVIAILFALSASADAHYIGSKCSDESTNRGPVNTLADCKHVAEVLHDVFRNDWWAHRTQDLGSCEGGLDKWAINDDHEGPWQFNADARETYGWQRRILIQVRALKRLVKARGLQPWEGGTCA